MNLRFLIALVSLFIFVSCTMYREYPIEVYRPGEIILPENLNNAAVVYRNFKYPGDTLLYNWSDGNQLRTGNRDINMDSLMVTVCINEMAYSLKYHNLFDEVLIFPYNTFERHNGEKMDNLPPKVVTQLSDDSDADLLIALETFSAFFSAYPEQYDSPQTNEVITVAVWSVYSPGKDLPLERKTMIDTIYWNGLDEQGIPTAGYRLPEREAALELASAMAGESYARRFFSDWHIEKRMYSVPPIPDFSEAAAYFEEGKFDEAIVHWEKYAANRNGRLAIEARFNLALAYELKDDLTTAQKWLEEAKELASEYRSKKNLQMIELYQVTLEGRQKDINRMEQYN